MPAKKKAEEETKDVAVVEENSTAVEAFDYGEFGDAGTDSSAIVTPFFKVLQPGSPEVGDELEGAEAGLLMDVTSGQFYDLKGDGVVMQLVNIVEEFVEWRHRDEGGGLVDRYEPNDIVVKKAQQRAKQDGLAYGKLEIPIEGQDEPNALVETHYLFFNLLSADGKEIVESGVLPCKSTHIKAISAINTSYLRASTRGVPTGKRAPAFAHRFILTSEKKKKDDYTYYALNARAFKGNWIEGRLNPNDPVERDLLMAGKTFRDQLDTGEREIDHAAEAAQAASSDTESTGGGDTPF